MFSLNNFPVAVYVKFLPGAMTVAPVTVCSFYATQCMLAATGSLDLMQLLTSPLVAASCHYSSPTPSTGGP